MNRSTLGRLLVAFLLLGAFSALANAQPASDDALRAQIKKERQHHRQFMATINKRVGDSVISSLTKRTPRSTARTVRALRDQLKHERILRKRDRRVAAHALTRSSLRFPPNPTMAEMRARVPDWEGFVRVGRCEQPKKDGAYGVDWGNPGPTYGGGLGMFAGTYRSAGSPYALFSPSIAEEILVADAVRDRFGIRAWGCAGVF